MDKKDAAIFFHEKKSFLEILSCLDVLLVEYLFSVNSLMLLILFLKMPLYTQFLWFVSGYSHSCCISSIVGALSSACLLSFSSPLIIFFHWMGISDISQNNIIALIKFLSVAPVIFSFSTLSFWNCKNLTMQLNAQFGSCSLICKIIAPLVNCLLRF